MATERASRGDRAAACGECGDASQEDSGLRCACGSLLARFVAGRVELKCRRCKRTVLLSIEPAEEPSAG